MNASTAIPSINTTGPITTNNTNNNGPITNTTNPITTPLKNLLPVSTDKETKKLEFDISSTNDLSYPYFSTGIQCISCGIQCFQAILLLFIIDENHVGSLSNKDIGMRLGQCFIFWYLTMYLPGELCNSLKFKMRLYYYRESDNGDSLILRSTSEKSLKDDIKDIMKFAILVIIQCFKSAFHVYIFCWKELFCPNDDELLQLPVPIHSRWFRLCGVVMEPFNVTLVIIASVFVSNAQTSLINLLFNFSGIIIVAQLDEIMISVLPKYKILVHVPIIFTNERRSFTQISCEQGFMMYVGFVLMCMFIAAA